MTASVSLFSRSSISFLSFFLLLLYFHFSFHLCLEKVGKSSSFLLVIWPLCLRTLCSEGQKVREKQTGWRSHTHNLQKYFVLFLKKHKLFFGVNQYFLPCEDGRADLISPLPTQPMCPSHLFPFLF